MPELPMRLHPLEPRVKCPACAGDLVFVRVRAGYGDLYQCASGGACKCQIIHYRSKEAKACGYAVVYKYGAIGEWTACDMPASASAKVRVKKKEGEGGVMRVSKVLILEISDLNTISIECASCGARVLMSLKDVAPPGKRSEIPGKCPSCDDNWQEIRIGVQKLRDTLTWLGKYQVAFHVPKPAAKG